MKALEISNLKKSYRTPDGALLPVIDIASLELDTGTELALEGSSGTGKTTLLHLIAGVTHEDAGRIVVAGEEMTGRREPARDLVRAHQIGYVFQTFNLLQGFTALENAALGMAFGSGIDSQWVEELLSRVGLADRLHFRPRELSVGQQQRVAIARALANRPALVLADEPTANLDSRLSEEAIELLRGVCSENGAALLLVSHDPTVLARFPRRASLAELNTARPVQSGAAPARQRVTP